MNELLFTIAGVSAIALIVNEVLIFGAFGIDAEIDGIGRFGVFASISVSYQRIFATGISSQGIRIECLRSFDHTGTVECANRTCISTCIALLAGRQY